MSSENLELSQNYIKTVVAVNRSSKVVKGGRRFGFSALVVCGDGQGSIGIGLGKAKEVSEAIKKGTEAATRNIKFVVDPKETVPHQITAKFKGSRIMLKPAGPGTGLIASQAPRSVFEALGIKNILTKSLGSSNPYSLVYATLKGLSLMSSFSKVQVIRFSKSS